MADTTPPAIIDVLGGSAGAQVPIDSTGTNYDGEFRFGWPYGTPAPYERGRLEVGGNFSQTDAQVDYRLRNFSASSDVVTISNVSDEPNRATAMFDPTDIEPSDNVGLRINVDTASGTAGATLDAGALITLLP